MPLRMLVIKHFIQEVMNLNFTFYTAIHCEPKRSRETLKLNRKKHTAQMKMWNIFRIKFMKNELIVKYAMAVIVL